MVDEKDKVVINSPETIAALEYAKELYETFIPGTLSWLDPNNNKAFLDGQIGLDLERHLGLLRGQELERSDDQGDGRGHRPCQPADRAGRQADRSAPDRAGDGLQATRKYPNAAKDYIRFMMEREQYVPWQTASIGYFSQPLRAYEKTPIWTADPSTRPIATRW